MIDHFYYPPDYRAVADLIVRHLDRLRAHYPQPIKDHNKQDSYKDVPCNQSGMLQVQDNPPHTIRWKEYGNPHGEPVMVLHGGPGARANSGMTAFFNRDRYRIILFDQRGCGDNTPNGSDLDATLALTNNTTPHLVGDIVKLRQELGIKGKMHLFGGSWGTTLALAYAIRHPETVQTLVLRAVFLCRKADIDYFFQGNAADFEKDPYAPTAAGAYLHPSLWKAWEKYVNSIAPKERGDMVGAFAKKLAVIPQNDEEKENLIAAAQAVASWDDSVGYLKSVESYEDDDVALRKYRIMIHYMMSDPLVGRKADNYILKHIDRISHIPLHMVQGEKDQTCHPIQAKALEHASKKAGNKNANLIIVKEGNHSGTGDMKSTLTRILNDLPMMSRPDLARRWHHRLQTQKQAKMAR